MEVRRGLDAKSRITNLDRGFVVRVAVQVPPGRATSLIMLWMDSQSVIVFSNFESRPLLIEFGKCVLPLACNHE